MPILSKQDLEYDYSWNNRPQRQQDPKDQGSADNDMFDRNRGNDVLEAINNYARENEIEDKERALELEEEMHQNMSQDITTQRGVRDWLDNIFGG